jgi:Restriction endonuclease S subunits
MIHNLKPYPAYKDSGVSWLGEVPEHWDVKRLKHICSKSALYGANIKATSYTPTGVRFLRTTDITNDGHLKKGGVSLSEDIVHDYLLNDGDLLVSRSGTVGRSFLYKSELHGPCAYAGYLVRFVPTAEIVPKYLFFFTKTQEFTEFLQVVAISSTIENVNGDKYANVLLPLPPLSEQSAIVHYLDYMDRRIRRYIHTKQKLIKLLEEQKQAIIHRAVTRGLDPDVKLKDSGVEWLGEVPEHWEVKPAKRYYREIDERSLSGSEELLSVSHITGITPRSEKNINMFMAKSYVGYKLCKENDLVINTMWAWAGALGIAKQTGIVSYSYAVYRPIQENTFMQQFIDLLLRTKPYIDEYVCRSTGIRSSRLRLYPEKFLRVPIIRPPIAEQQAILENIVNSTNKLENSIQTTQQEITLLKEYRTRLISDIVIGKLDVRAAAVSLPVETEDEETFEDEVEDIEENTDDEFEEMTEED